MRFPPSFLDSISARMPISDVVGRRVTWDKRKSQPQRGDFWACCPFHGEKTPSFHADDRRGIYHCFGCGVSGDHFRFLTELDGLSFPEAVELLAGEAGVAMPARDPDAERREKKRASLVDVMELAATFFEEQLRGESGARARDYLRQRGIDASIQKRFRIGYAHDSRNALKQHLASRGIAGEQSVECGLLVAGDDIPVSYDRFRDRVMFPIVDLAGKVIAFGGRALSPEASAKYLNSPETSLFSKSHVLFNAREARAAARKGGPVIAVEGYTDVIACVAAGFEATVAPMGTALTQEQLRLLWQMADEPVLCFDGDKAGRNAAFRACDVALPHLKPGKSLRFALLPSGQDPDDLIRSGGAERFSQAIQAARPLVDLIWMRETAGKTFETPERRAGLEKSLHEATAQINDGTIRKHYDFAFRDRVYQNFSRLPRKPGGRGARPQAASESLLANPMVRASHRNMPSERISLAEAIVVGTLISHPEIAPDRLEHLAEISFRDAAVSSLAEALAALVSEQPGTLREHVRSQLERQGHGKAIQSIFSIFREFGLGTMDADAERAAAIWDDAVHLRRSTGPLAAERLEAATALGREADSAHLTRLRDIQYENLRLARTDAGDGVSDVRIVHPFKDR